jgi:dolichol-phosphate mannosyltransferase
LEKQTPPAGQVLVCTVLPTYNERANIGPLIDGILDSAITPHMVLVVDDDSPDGTWQAVEDAVERRGSRVALIRRQEERGLTSAIQRGIDEAIGVYGVGIVTWMDCDLSMPPQDIPRLVRAIVEDDADVAVGSRWIRGGGDEAHGFMARSLSWIINHFAMLLLGRQVHDYTSGFIAARSDVLRRIRLRGDYGEYCIDLLGRAVKLGYHVRDAPYICVPRASGVSKTGASLWEYLAKGRKYVATIWRLRFESEDSC